MHLTMPASPHPRRHSREGGNPDFFNGLKQGITAGTRRAPLTLSLSPKGARERSQRPPAPEAASRASAPRPESLFGPVGAPQTERRSPCRWNAPQPEKPSPPRGRRLDEGAGESLRETRVWSPAATAPRAALTLRSDKARPRRREEAGPLPPTPHPNPTTIPSPRSRPRQFLNDSY